MTTEEKKQKVFEFTSLVHALEIYHVPADSKEEQAREMIDENCMEYFVETSWDILEDDGPIEFSGFFDEDGDFHNAP